jgi:hypothetical protein
MKRKGGVRILENQIFALGILLAADVLGRMPTNHGRVANAMIAAESKCRC